MKPDGPSQTIKWLRYLMVVFYLFAGINHFWHPNFYLPLIPDYLPFPKSINFVSGFVEIILAIGLLFPKTQNLAAHHIVFLLILLIPSHIYFIQQGSCIEGGLCVAPWIAWVRLLVIHPLLIWWAWVVR